MGLETAWERTARAFPCWSAWMVRPGYLLSVGLRLELARLKVEVW